MPKAIITHSSAMSHRTHRAPMRSRGERKRQEKNSSSPNYDFGACHRVTDLDMLSVSLPGCIMPLLLSPGICAPPTINVIILYNTEVASTCPSYAVTPQWPFADGPILNSKHCEAPTTSLTL
jgi:hypothetical protein